MIPNSRWFASLIIFAILNAAAIAATSAWRLTPPQDTETKRSENSDKETSVESPPTIGALELESGETSKSSKTTSSGEGELATQYPSLNPLQESSTAPREPESLPSFTLPTAPDELPESEDSPLVERAILEAIEDGTIEMEVPPLFREEQRLPASAPSETEPFLNRSSQSGNRNFSESELSAELLSAQKIIEAATRLINHATLAKAQGHFEQSQRLLEMANQLKDMAASLLAP